MIDEKLIEKDGMTNFHSFKWLIDYYSYYYESWLMTYLESHSYGNPGLMVFLCIFGTIWLFVAIAIICDDFFVPSLEAISEAGFQIDTF